MASNKVLIIGNGAAGSQLSAKLAKSKDIQLTVVTPFNYSEISVNMTKAIASGSDEHLKCVFPLLKEDNVDYVIDTCTELTSSLAKLHSGRSINFDVCIIATGQNIPSFYPDINCRTFAERKQYIHDLSIKIKNATCVVVGGGGAIGSEVAADIKLRSKHIRVILVHSHTLLLNGMHEPFQKLGTEHMRSIGVELMLSDRVVAYENNEVLLASGSRIACDVYLPAHPVGGNSSFLPVGCTDSKGYVKVDDTFAVQLMNNVFAFGDCCDFDRAKTYPKIYDQLVTVRHNVLASLRGQALKHHVRHGSFMGRLEGPLFVALGHGLDERYGLGPDCPGWLGTFNWWCCVLSWPCSYPAGSFVAKIKSDFNDSIRPQKGKGFSG